MAKKEKVDLGNLNFDMEDDWGKDDMAPVPHENKKNGRNPVEKAGRTVLREMGKSTLTRAMAKRVLEGALPPSFTVMNENIDRTLTDTRGMIQTIKRDAGPMVREFRALGRTLNRLFPTRYKDKINSILAESGGGAGGLNNVNLEDIAVGKSVNDVFGQATPDQKRRAEDENGRELIKELTDQEFRKRLGTAVVNIQDLLSRQTTYNFSVQRAYQKKMMELQIRQLMIGRSQLDVTQKAAVETSNLLRNIVENTGLPDVVKVRRSEEFMKMAREGLYGKAQKKLGDWSRNYRENLSKRIVATVKNRTDRFAAGFSMANATAEQLEQQREMLESMGVDPSEFLAGAAGNQGAMMLGRRIGKSLNRRFPQLQRTNGLFNRANYLFNNKEKLAAEYGRSGYQYGKWYHPATNALKDTLRSTYNDGGTIRAGGMKGIENGVGETETRKLRALEEIIPGYLSRILHSIDQQRTGDKNTKRVVYNHQKGTFTTFDESVKDVKENLLGQGEIDKQRQVIERLLSQIDPTGKLKGTTRETVIKFLYQRSRTSRAFNPAAMANESIPGLTGDDKTVWQGLLASRYGLTLNAEGKWAGNIYSGRNQNMNKDAGEFNYASNQTVGLYNRAHALGATGNLEQLIQEGAVVFKKGEWVLNQDYYDKRVNGNEANPPGPGDSRRDTETPPTPRPPGGGPNPLPNGNRRFDYFGGGYPNPNNLGDYRVGPMGGKKDNCDCIKDALAAQVDRIIAEMKPHHLLVAEGFPMLEAQLERIRLSAGQGGGSGAPGEGAPPAGDPGQRRRRFHRLRQGLSLAGRGARAYWNVTALPFKGAAWLGKKALSPLKALGGGSIRHAFGFLTGAGQAMKDQMGDGYIQGREGLKKVIDKEGLRSGRYIDQKTGEVIRKLSEIKGAVWDTAENTQVITDDEARGGLFTAEGKKIKTHAFGVIGGAASVLRKIMFPSLGVGRMARGLTGAIKNILMRVPDIYVMGETTPRLYSSKIARGEYYQVATGKRVKSLSDLNTDIGTLDMTTGKLTPILTMADIAKGLVDRNGRKLRTPLSRMLGGVGRLAALPLLPLKMMGKAMLSVGNLAGDIAGGLMTGTGKILRRTLGLGGGGDRIGKGSNNYLKKIYKLLVNHFTGKPPLEGLEEKEKGPSGFNRIKGRTRDYLSKLSDRGGSWLNRMKNFGHSKKEQKEEVKKAEAGGGWGKLILAAIGGIGSIIGGIRSGFSSFFGWIKDLPKWLGMLKGGGDLADAAGDLADGGGRRRRGGWLKRTGRALLKGGKVLGKGALAAGSFLGRGVVMGGLRMLGGAALSLLSAPVALTVAAVAGAGYLIYKGYQAYSNRMTDLREYRVAQYGFNPKETDNGGKVLALEEAVLSKTKINSDGKATVGALAFQELMSAFDVEATDQKSVLRWTRWYKMRFQPIFIRNVETLYKMDPKAKITDATFLRDGQKPQFARDTFFNINGEGSPYMISDSPFPQGSCYVGSKFPASYRDKIIATYKDKEATDKKNGKGQASVAAASAAPKASELIPRRTDITASPIAVPKGINAATDLYFSPGDTVATPGGITGSVAKDELIQIGNRIDDLTAIRVKVYGLTVLLKDRVNALINFERAIYKDVRFGSGGVSTFQKSTEDTFHEHFGAFGLNPMNGDEKNSWIFWFENRFLPTFLNFCSQAKKVAPNTDPFNAWQRLSSADLLSIAQRINQTTTEIKKRQVSVWTVTASPWPKETSGSDASIIETNLEAMRAMSKKEVYSESLKTKAELDKMTFDGKALKQTAIGNKIYDLAGDLGAATGNSQLRAKGADGQGAYAQHYASTGTSYDVSGAGMDYVNDNVTHIGEGSGGNINTLPVPQGNGWGNAKELIVAAAKMSGVDAGSLAATLAIESNFNGSAKNGSSSATGMGQFTSGTWAEILPILVKKYGINPNTPSSDPRASVLATAEYMKQNAKSLGNIGRPLTTTDLYMAHFLGAGDAKKVLGADANTPIQAALGDRYNKVASANKDIFANVRTTGDLIRYMGNLVAKKGGSYIDEANALAQRGGGGVNPDGTGQVTPAGMATSGTGKPTGTASTPTTSSTGGTEKTPAIMTAKTPLPQGDASAGRALNRGTDLAPSAASRPVGTDTVTDAVATNDAITEATSRAVRTSQRRATTDANKRIEQGESMNTSLGYLKNMDGSLTKILEVIQVLVGKPGGGDSTSPGAKSTESERALAGQSIQTPTLAGKPSSNLPFNTSNNSGKYK